MSSSKWKSFPNAFPTGFHYFFRLSEMKTCPQSCNFTSYRTSATFFNLESPSTASVKNEFTIRPKPGKSFAQTETEIISIYVVICDLANVVSMYSGLSGAAFLHTIVIIILFGYVIFIFGTRTKGDFWFAFFQTGTYQ